MIDDGAYFLVKFVINDGAYKIDQYRAEAAPLTVIGFYTHALPTSTSLDNLQLLFFLFRVLSSVHVLTLPDEDEWCECDELSGFGR